MPGKRYTNEFKVALASTDPDRNGTEHPAIFPRNPILEVAVSSSAPSLMYS
jgi:hypothetical protein